jgi:hypothetical protein
MKMVLVGDEGLDLRFAHPLVAYAPAGAIGQGLPPGNSVRVPGSKHQIKYRSLWTGTLFGG